MPSPVLTISGTRLFLDGAPFYLQGLSFFNALYNASFNQSPEQRLHWLEVFSANGINCLRVWCQWNFEAPCNFADTSPSQTLYSRDGAILDETFRRLADLIEAAEKKGIVLEIVLFSLKKEERQLPIAALERAARMAAEYLIPYRGIILQIWNEQDLAWQRLFEAIKSIDKHRLVTSSPGDAGVLGDPAHNRAMDLLTPHTVRTSAGPFWEEAPRQIAGLLAEYGKPVIDDEPARCGTLLFGGIEGGTLPWQHIEQLRRVRAVGGYHVYHHDMFQFPYGSPSTPPDGIPAPNFSPFHSQVFAYLRDHPRW